jgi:hypothetical protein
MSTVSGSPRSEDFSSLHRRLDWRSGLLGCGVVSSVLYLVSIDLLAPLRHPDYHRYTDQMVSELLAIHAPTRPLLVWLFVPYNLMVLGFALGIWKFAGTQRMLRFAAAAMAAYGVSSSVGLLLTPMDLRGTVNSHRDSLHIANTFVMSIFIVTAMAFGGQMGTRLFRRYTYVTILLVMVFGGLAGYLARPMPEPTPWLGLAERVNIYATMTWFSLFAVSVGVSHKSRHQEGS